MLHNITSKETACPNVNVPQTAVTTVTWNAWDNNDLFPTFALEFCIFNIVVMEITIQNFWSLIVAQKTTSDLQQANQYALSEYAPGQKYLDSRTQQV